MSEVSNGTFEKVSQQLWKSVEAENKWRSTIAENLLSIIGFVTVIVASIWLYNSTQSVSQSLTELAPSKDVFEQNIDKISILFGASGIQMTTAFGVLGSGMATMAFGIAWASYRSSNRNAKIIIYVMGSATEEILKNISAGVQQLDNRLDNKQDSSLQIKSKASKDQIGPSRARRRRSENTK